MRIAESYLRSD